MMSEVRRATEDLHRRPPRPLIVFFDCLKNNNSPQSQWYHGMKTKLHRTIFQRQMLHGEAMDNSANAIYLNEVRQLSAALARADTVDLRKV